MTSRTQNVNDIMNVPKKVSPEQQPSDGGEIVDDAGDNKTTRKSETTRKRCRKCPACGNSVEIPSDKRPQIVECEECYKEFILRGDSGIQFKRCRCGKVIGIPTNVRPLDITCKNCGHVYMLRKKPYKTVKAAANRSLDDILAMNGNRLAKRKTSLEAKNYAREKAMSAAKCL